MKALVLAAGYATRLYPLTKDFPKPLLTVGGKAILDYLIDNMRNLPGLDAVYVVTNSKFTPHFQAWAKALRFCAAPSPCPVEIIDDGTDSNETRRGAVADMWYAIQTKGIHDDLLVAAGDNIYTMNLSDFYRFFAEKNSDVILSYRITSLDKLRRTGVLQVDALGRVIGFEEKPVQPKSDLGCPALYLFQKKSLSLIPAYLDQGGNPDAPGHFISWLYQQHPVYAFLMTQPYYDVGNLESYYRICKQIETSGFSY
ncbi:nucleotidyltransferase family protein [bacterium]|nr:nucleotidyltransferase family protein [bacterium]